MATTKVFRSGNAMAVRLPASFKAVAGTAVEVREEQGRWIVEPVDERGPRIDLDGNLWIDSRTKAADSRGPADGAARARLDREAAAR